MSANQPTGTVQSRANTNGESTRFYTNFLLLRLLASLVLLPGCSSGDAGPILPWQAEAPGPEARQVHTMEWDTLWSVGGALEDSVMPSPGYLETSDSMLAVLDFVSNRVVAFDHDGTLLWTYGDPGEGPRELISARDMAFTGPREISVLDPGNEKIVELDRNGEVARIVSLAEVGHHVEQFVPLDSKYLLLSAATDSSIFLLNRDGSVEGRWPWPWPQLEKLHIIVRQGFTAADGDRWVFALLRANGWFAFRDTVPLTAGRSFVEHLPLPEVVTEKVGNRRITRTRRSACSACAVTMEDSLVYVLFGGTGSRAQRVVDVFRWDTGNYEHSYHLPYRAVGIAVSDNRLYVMSANPYPQLQALRPRRK